MTTMAAKEDMGNSSRRRLARIRCVRECVQCFKQCKPVPEALCHVPDEIEYQISKNTKTIVYTEPSKKSSKVVEINFSPEMRVVVSGEEMCNAEGEWGRLLKHYSDKAKKNPPTTFDQECWILLCPTEVTSENANIFSHVTDDRGVPSNCVRWQEVVEHHYSAKHGQRYIPADKEAIARLRILPPNWSIVFDEVLCQYLSEHTETGNENLGSVKNYVEKIDVSSFCEDDGAKNLTDSDPDTFWESDGSQGRHWIRLKMKKGTIIKKLIVTIDGNDDNYMPYKIVTMGGELDNMKKLHEVTTDLSLDRVSDICILEDQSEHHPYIEIRIKECKDDGIDTRIHGIKIKSTREKEIGLCNELFKAENLVRYPKLESFSMDILYRRALVLLRFTQLLESVLPYIVPAWEFSIGSYSSLEAIRQFLPLSKKRFSLIDTFLRESESGRPNRMPKIYINRRQAAEHRADPTQDPECKNSIFNQIYEGLKPREPREQPLDYRWPSRHDQWWECKFIAEGIIDQGGGFRDSLSDMADELCPSSTDCPVPLPFFIRSPNQSQEDTVNRDMYIPNPSCTEMHKYEWLGKVMGACMRGKECLVLSLPAFIWKKLVGETVQWSRDFMTVDAAAVKLIDSMESMDEEQFNAFFGSERTWTCILSARTVVPLRENGADTVVSFEERLKYASEVQKVRMAESDKQVEAMRRGLLSVIPQAVLDLLTWQELEKRICGDPEITVEALKKTTHYEDLEPTDTRVVHMWEALSNFSNEDRSRFLRFVTGRRRLPAPLYICQGKEDSPEALPESSTCANTLYLPNYSSAKVTEEKLRYAAYNCIAIDTDMSPWDE